MNLAIAVAILFSAVSWFLLPFFWRKLKEMKLALACRHHGLIALTYDDGPGTELTSKLIELLRKHDVKASFFVLGQRAKLRPDLVTLLIDEGHDVGSHTQNHSNAWKTNPFTTARDISAGIADISQLNGNAALFRPPFGKMTLASLIDGAIRRLTFAFWTVDTQDSWKRRSIQSVTDEIERAGGGVVLMHDYDEYGSAPDGVSHLDYVLNLTDEIIILAKKRGLKLVPFRVIEDYAGRVQSDA